MPSTKLTKAINNARYYRKHRAEKKAYDRKRYLANRDEILKYNALMAQIKKEQNR